MYSFIVLVLIFSATSVFSEDCKPGTCDVHETCCPTGIPGDFKCCPFANAVCCEDNAFCCQKDNECDIITGKCIPNGAEKSKQRSLNQLEKRSGETDEESFNEDKTDVCQPGETCCPTDAPGGCNCCPYSNAVCCEGHSFCCPENYECDIVQGVCSPKELVTEEPIATIEKRHGLLHEGENLKLQCNDGSICNADTTCCIIRNGKFGCCPHAGAMCCADMIHCCPSGQVCDTTSRYCINKHTVDEPMVTESALPIDFEDSD